MIELVETFGPTVGILLILLFFLARALDRILKQLEGAYQRERDYLQEQNRELLRHLLNRPQVPAEEDPDIPELPRRKDPPQQDMFLE